MDKILLIDKPAGWTSFDVVARIRASIKYQVAGSKNELSTSLATNYLLPTTRVRVGHAGTLDPFATGLLIVLVGGATKKQDQFMKLDKEYIASLRLCATSTTGDPEGAIEEFPISNFQIPNKSQILEILKQFTGEITQIPPKYSAIKVNGERAYKLAREGKEVEIKPRQVTIYELEVLSFEFPVLNIRVKCSSGTYIRTLAEDIGKALGSGAYLTELRRTKIGEYVVEDAMSVEEATSD